jgi:hypothetical protein
MKHLFLKIVLIFVTTLNSSCEDVNTNESTGNDTFSCYINGKLYVPSAGTGIGSGDIRPFNWSYSNLDDITTPYFFSISSSGDYAVSINIATPKVGKDILDQELDDTIDFSHSGMIVKNSNEFYNTRNNQENGSVNFTELSKTKAIGTLECALYDEKGKELKVTNGKFNLSLDSRTN